MAQGIKKKKNCHPPVCIIRNVISGRIPQAYKVHRNYCLTRISPVLRLIYYRAPRPVTSEESLKCEHKMEGEKKKARKKKIFSPLKK